MKNIFAAALILSLLPLAAARADAPSLDHGSFAASCAPWDGGAVRFEITPEGKSYPQIGVAIYKAVTYVKPGSYDIPMASHDGNVNYCTENMKCEIVKSGTLNLEEVTPWTTAKISYDLQLKDGTQLKGEATLKGSDERQFCG